MHFSSPLKVFSETNKVFLEDECPTLKSRDKSRSLQVHLKLIVISSRLYCLNLVTKTLAERTL